MTKPIIAIVGRPNVGKSTLFNRLIGHRQALVDDYSGVTRDRHYGEGDWLGYHFVVIDTGGIEADDAIPLMKQVRRQSLIAVEEADAVICLFDATSGLTPVDRHVVEVLRKTNKPVLYGINKVDGKKQESLLSDFYDLGIDPLVPLSSEHGRGVDDLLDKMIEQIERHEEQRERSDAIRVAVIGRPNVGKSTLINRTAGVERVVVHEEAGTTRDTIDVAIEAKGQKFIFVDTAGVKRKGKTSDKLEKFTIIKSLRAIERADVVLALTVAKEGITRQDMHMISFAFTERKPVIIFVNKWDEIKDVDEDDFIERTRNSIGELSRLPIKIISGKTGYNCNSILDAVVQLKEIAGTRITTSKLNKAFEEMLARHHIPSYQGKSVKLFYVTQKNGRTPSFVLFTNRPEGIKESYKRYIKNSLQELLGLPGLPISLEFRKK